ncbi:MAG: phosphoethanolamine transferase [Paludibacteraceae bacterium]|nr:phosphoethanolamine transferase [Paludibacteraceae bacterium]
MKDKREIRSVAWMIAFLVSPTLLGLILADNISSSDFRVMANTTAGDIAAYLLYIIGGMACYAMGLAVFKRKTFFYIATLTFVPAGIDIVHQILNGATTSLLFLYTCAIAEAGELWELFTTYWWVLGTAIALWISYLILNRKHVKNEYIIANRRLRYVIAAVCLVFYLVFGHLEAVRQSNPANTFIYGAEVVRLQRTIKNADKTLRDFRFGAEYKKEDATQSEESEDLVVFLIGETTRYDHWHLNGYGRETSPMLDARAGQIVSFDSCYSVSNLTAVSVPMMLSRATPDELGRLYEEKSLTEVFQEAGYMTAWIADQSFTNEQLLRISSACDESYYFEAGNKLQRSFMDSVLLPPLRQEIAKAGNRKEMIVIHSLGCHFKYSARYPERFSVFLPDMKEKDIRAIIENMDLSSGKLIRDRLILNEIRDIFVNSYDNAILFTDWFIDAVIKELEQTGSRAVLVYVSDHGENLLDDERNMLLHGSYYGSRYEYHVPLFIWTSSQYRDAYPEKIRAMEANKNKVISTMHLFHSLLDLGHVRFPGWEQERSVCSDSCREENPVIGLDANLKCKEIPK